MKVSFALVVLLNLAAADPGQDIKAIRQMLVLIFGQYKKEMAVIRSFMVNWKSEA